MNSQPPPRTFTRIAAALVVAAVVIAAAILATASFSTTVTTTTTTQLTTTQTQTSGSNPFQDNGYITIGSVGNFIYTRIPISGYEPTASTTLQNVTFTYLKPNGTTTGAICYSFKATFQDSSSENLTACSFPTNFETSVVFSNHTTTHNSIPPTTTPTAGLILIPSGGPYIYALVSI